MAVDVDRYLQRIAYDGHRLPAVETLRGLHRAHVVAVPFENLDIHAGREIVLDEARMVAKIVDERRGGFCYEVNGCFAALLREMGFAVTLLSAGVRRDDGAFGPEFDHLLVRVDLDEPWLADVSTFVEPLRLIDGPQDDSRYTYRLERDRDGITLMRRERDGAWTARFRVTLSPWQLSDFAGMCRYHQTSPDSHFTRGRVCTRLTPDGRVTLAENRLIVTSEGARTETALEDETVFANALREHFDIVLQTS